LLTSIQQQGFFQENTNVQIVDKVEQEEGEPDLKYFRLDGSLASYSTEESLAEFKADPHPEEKHGELVLRRNAAESDEIMKELEAQAAGKFIKDFTVVMFGIKLASITAQNGSSIIGTGLL